MLCDITIPEIPIIITLEPQNSAYVYSGHCSENRTLFPSILSKIRIYLGQKPPENEKYPLFLACSQALCFVRLVVNRGQRAYTELTPIPNIG